MRPSFRIVLMGAALTGGLLAQSTSGKAIFEGKGGCIECHSVENRGGSLGPDLSEVGIMRSPESLRLSLIDPNAEIFQEYLTVVVVTKAGERIEGIGLNEDDLSIQLRDKDSNPRSFLKENVREVRREARSLMPSYRSKLSPAEIDSVLDYLRTLRGTPGVKTARTRKIPPEPLSEDFLTRPERDADERPDSLLDALNIPAGASVADLGAGPGYFTWRLAQRVGPRGKVIAVDGQQSMLDLNSQDLKKRNLRNVELKLSGEGDPKLPAGSLDLVLIANAYHAFSQPEAVLASVRRSLKPGGRLVVIEFSKENSFVPLPAAQKMSLPEMRSEIEPEGFQLDRILDFLPMQHCLIFSIAAAATPSQ